MARPLPIRIRWTLLFAATIIAIAIVPLGYVYVNIERRFYQEATLMLSSLMEELLDEMPQQPTGPEFEALAHHVASFNRELRLGVAIVAADGTLAASAGSLAGRSVPLPEHVGRKRGRPVTFSADLGGTHDALVQAVDAPIGLLEVSMDIERYHRRANEFRELIAATLPLAALFAGLAGWWLSGRSLRPVVEITAAARRITADNLGERLPLRGTRDELDQLAATLNDMFARIEEGIEKLRSFSVHAAHQLRSPILRLRSRLDVALETEELPEAEKGVLRDLLLEVESFARLVEGMLRLSRSEAGLRAEQRAPVPLAELLESVAEFFEPFADQKGVELRTALRAEAVVPGDASWLRELFANLLDNAVRYTPRGGSIEVRLEARDGCALVEVADSGVGIEPDSLDRIFDRFYRAPAQGGTPGLGLGLAITREIARAHGGSVEVESEPGRGSRFRVKLPLLDASASARRAQARSSPISSPGSKGLAR